MKRRIIPIVFALALLINCVPGFAAVKTMPDGGQFDPQFYAANNPDVTAVLGTDENALYQHYLTFGKNEGRAPFAAGASDAPAGASGARQMPDGGLFDPVFYAAAYPDVAAVFGNNAELLYQHYLTAGKAEGRLPYAPQAAATAPVPTAARNMAVPPAVTAPPTTDRVQTTRFAGDEAMLLNNVLLAGNIGEMIDMNKLGDSCVPFAGNQTHSNMLLVAAQALDNWNALTGGTLNYITSYVLLAVPFSPTLTNPQLNPTYYQCLYSLIDSYGQTAYNNLQFCIILYDQMDNIYYGFCNSNGSFVYLTKDVLELPAIISVLNATYGVPGSGTYLAAE